MTPRWSSLWSTPLALAAFAVMAASLILGYYSYDAANRIAESSEASIIRSNRVVGERFIDRITKLVVSTGRMLFEMVRLEDPKDFRELWGRIVKTSPVVQDVVVLDSDLRVVHLIGGRQGADRQRFRRIFMTRILPDMRLKQLTPELHRHIHRRYDDKFYLIAYIRRQAARRDYYVALNINLTYFKENLFPKEFQDLEESKHIAIVDYAGGIHYGSPVPKDAPFVFEKQFPGTLYRWRLQLAPRKTQTLLSVARTRRITNLVLVGAAEVLILVGLVIIIIAVRKEKRAGQLQSEFISGVTHELKTPISLIRMFGELLSMDRPGREEKVKEYGGIITRESQRLSNLIDNVLDFARMERGKSAYQMVPDDLGEIITRVVDLLRHRADQMATSIKVDIEPNLPQCRFDRNALMIVLFNLLDNALKYGPEKDGEIEVVLRKRENTFLLQVANIGPSIPREEQKQVFDKFYRGKAARQLSVRGSGIGLTLVRHVVEAHGGKIRVEPRSDDKTCFSISLPLRMEAKSQQNAADAAPHATTDGSPDNAKSLSGQARPRNGREKANAQAKTPIREKTNEP